MACWRHRPAAGGLVPRVRLELTRLSGFSFLGCYVYQFHQRGSHLYLVNGAGKSGVPRKKDGQGGEVFPAPPAPRPAGIPEPLRGQVWKQVWEGTHGPARARRAGRRNVPAAGSSRGEPARLPPAVNAQRGFRPTLCRQHQANLAPPPQQPFSVRPRGYPPAIGRWGRGRKRVPLPSAQLFFTGGRMWEVIATIGLGILGVVAVAMAAGFVAYYLFLAAAVGWRFAEAIAEAVIDTT